MTDYWSGSVIPPPRLRFDPGIPSRAHKDPFPGLKKHGAYSLGALEGHAPRLLLAYPRQYAEDAGRFRLALFEGSGNYPGFAQLFGLPPSFQPEVSEHKLPELPPRTQGVRALYEDALKEWAGASPPDFDLAFVVVPHTDRWELDSAYYAAKAFFAARQTPTQMVTRELLYDERRLGWSLANIALAAFAKLGGKPWVVDARGYDGDLVIGVGRADIRDDDVDRRRRIFGYAVAFISNGAYLDTASFTPAADEHRYQAELTRAVARALTADRAVDVQPQRLIFHMAKRTGGTEIEAVREALRQAQMDRLPTAFLRVDDSSLFEFIDSRQLTYAPPKGLAVRLAERRALVQTEGLSRLSPSRRPLLLELDRRSTVDPDHELGRLALQVFRLAHANWRGLNARSKPVSILYGEQLAEIVGYMSQATSWDPSTLREELQSRPWFL